MKQKDIALILVVVVFAGIVSLIFTNIVFPSKARQLKAEKVSPISSQFNKPDPKVFNKDAINPTQLIHIGDNNNPDPF